MRCRGGVRPGREWARVGAWAPFLFQRPQTELTLNSNPTARNAEMASLDASWLATLASRHLSMAWLHLR